MSQYGALRNVRITSDRPYSTTYYEGANSQKMINSFHPAQRQNEKAIADRRQVERFIIHTGGDDRTAAMIIKWVDTHDDSDSDFNLRTIQNVNLDADIPNSLGQEIDFYVTARAMGMKRDVQGDSLRDSMIEYLEEKLLDKPIFEAAMEQLHFDTAPIYKILREMWIKLGELPDAERCRRDFRRWCADHGYEQQLEETVGRIERERSRQA